MSSFFDYPGGEPALARSSLIAFESLGRADWERLVAAMERRRFAQGAVVMQRGENDRSLYLVTTGSVEIFVGAERDEQSIGVQGPGSILGEVAFFDGGARSATVRAVTATEVLRLSPEAFEALAARHPDLGRRILMDLGRTLAFRLRRAEADDDG